MIGHSDGRRFSQSLLGRLLARFSVARKLRFALRILLWRFSFRYSVMRFASSRRAAADSLHN